MAGIDRLGGTLLIPAFAQVLVATSDSVVLGSQLDVDLFRPIVEMYVSVIKLP